MTPSRIQFIIPIWQRTYSWEWQQWRDLWEDLMDLYEKLCKGESAQHFMGPIVLKTLEQKIGGITRWVIIDGQQRLTTLLLICALIRDMAKDRGDINLVKEIEGQFLFNEFAKKIEDKPKLFPTEADRKFFDLILRGEKLNVDQSSQLHAAYAFFEKTFKTEQASLELERLLDCVRSLKMVTIRLEEGDNPNRIFETLNFRGKPLAQSDLVRNFFMMSIKEPAKADDVYLNVWFPMQQALGKDTLQRIENLEMFLRHYMVMIKQTVVKEDKIYTEIRGRLKHYNEDQMISELQIISEYSKLYERLLFPERETDPEISKGIERLNRLKIGVHYPFLLKIYKNFASQKVSKDDFCSILKIIESYIVRRFFKRLPTHSLNRLFAELCKLHESNISNELETLLANKEEWTAQYWPKDEDFKEQFLKLPIYKISSEKCRFVLETLEEYFKHPEPVKLDNLWIEHIMPETLSPEWKEYLGENWKATYDNYLHTIGNLTLIAPDRDISIQNKMYSEKKKEWYDTSNISLTRELKDNWDNWRESQILERAKILAERAIKIWPRPE
jgi:uncharacterized protein with ParB-like and HNH nuclease domain